MKYTLMLLTSLMAATSALEESNSSACQGAISMPTFNCNCNNPPNKQAVSPGNRQTCEASSYESPALSCEEVAQSKPRQLPSYQWIKNSTFDPVMVYCTAATQCCTQGDVGWMKVADFDMSDPHQDCPPGFQERSAPSRCCGRTLNMGGCQSMVFQTQGVTYSKVCGWVIGYQYGSPSGFYTPGAGSNRNSIDHVYLEGVSITHGSSPRKHIWSFANGLMEADGYNGNRHICPCASTNSQMQQYIPSFVGNDYFCETGATTSWTVNTFYTPSDPLRNGSGCSGTNTCCTFNNPLWFCKELSQSTTDDIEVRLCADQNGPDEDSLIHLIELYVKW